MPAASRVIEVTRAPGLRHEMIDIPVRRSQQREMAMDVHDKRVQEAAVRVITSLAQGRGIDEADAEDLRQALRDAAVAWASLETISKVTANLFVDLWSSIEAVSNAYRGEQAQRISYFADEIGALCRECVRVPDES